MDIKKIGILGGSGFLGCMLARELSNAGYALKILTRARTDNHAVLGSLANLEQVEVDVHDQEQLCAALSGCDAVINLVGILNEGGRNGSGFQHVHVALTDKVVRACRRLNIQRLLHMSAINADAAAGASHYLRSKGEAEDLAHAATGIRVTSYRPSVIFGSEDSFFNRFATLLKLAPLVFPLACARARFAPVFVEDVAKVIVATVAGSEHDGKRYDLCGPKIYTLHELVEFTAKGSGRHRIIIPLPDVASKLQGLAFDLAAPLFQVLNIEQPFSTDNYLSTKVDAVCRCNHLPTFGIVPTAIEDIVPDYLGNRQ